MSEITQEQYKSLVERVEQLEAKMTLLDGIYTDSLLARPSAIIKFGSQVPEDKEAPLEGILAWVESKIASIIAPLHHEDVVPIARFPEQIELAEGEELPALPTGWKWAKITIPVLSASVSARQGEVFKRGDS